MKNSADSIPQTASSGKKNQKETGRLFQNPQNCGKIQTEYRTGEEK